MIESRKNTAIASDDPDEVPDLTAPEWKAALMSAPVMLGDVVVRPGRPKAEHPKERLNIRLDADVVAHFRASGKGWQTRLNATLRKAIGLS